MKTIFWLRWTMRRNQLARAGTLNAIIGTILLVLCVLGAVTFFVTSLVAGIFLLPKASAEQLMYTWDVIITAFLFLWAVRLISELQRSEVISIEKILHLPLSVKNAFVYNYLASLFTFELILLIPLMLGLSIALVVVKGPVMLILFPLLAGMIAAVTAITYQFRGWLATLMVNKRRRRTIIVLITAGFVILAQAPYLFFATFNSSRMQQIDPHMQEIDKQLQNLKELDQSFHADEITHKQYLEQSKPITDQLKHSPEAIKKIANDLNIFPFENMSQSIVLINTFFPPGWLAYGAMAAAKKNLWPGLLGSLGLFLITLTSLHRSYRTTLKYYLGGFQAGKSNRKAKPATAQPIPKSKTASLLEKKIPGISEHAAAIALANFRSLLRAPEIKLGLMMPVIMLFIFSTTIFSQQSASIFRGDTPDIPIELRAFAPLGIILMINFSLLQIYQNQFGFDRNGFRTLVLAPASRKDILLGKNLSLAPFAFFLTTIGITIAQVIIPMPVAHVIAACCHLISGFLIACILGNQISIISPMAQPSGTLRTPNVTFVAGLLRMLFAVLLPLALFPLAFPLLIELLFHSLDWGTSIPICLILSLLELIAVIYLYRRILSSQAELLQKQQLKILEAVVSKNE